MKLLSIFYLVALHVIVGVAVVKTDIIQRVQVKLGFEVMRPELTPHYEAMLAFHRRVDANLPAGSVLFIGDSLVQGLTVGAIHSQSVNFGIGQDTTLGVLNRIPHYRSIAKSKLIVLAVGVNDLKRRSDDEIIENYGKIVALIPHNIPILFSGIFPVDEVKSNLIGYNARINRINRGLNKLCADSPRLYYFSMSDFIQDSHGELDDDYHIGDGMHLNSLANAAWISRLKALINSIAL